MAQLDYFLKIPGVTGESTDKAHAGEIEILSWNWGASNSGAHESGTEGGSAGRGNVNDLSFSMRANKATPKLMQYCVSGKHIEEEVVLTCRRAGDKPQDYFTVRLKPVYITSYSTGGSAGDIIPVDNLSLNFGAIKFEYKPQKKDGTLDAAVEGAYNVQKNEASYPAK